MSLKLVARGGTVMQRPPNSVPGTIQGYSGGWSDTAGAWAAGPVEPTMGHAVANIFYGRANAMWDFLNRNAVPGQLEANTMHTDIQMNGGGAARGLVGAGNLDALTLSNSRGADIAVTGGLTATTNIKGPGLVGVGPSGARETHT